MLCVCDVTASLLFVSERYVSFACRTAAFTSKSNTWTLKNSLFNFLAGFWVFNLGCFHSGDAFCWFAVWFCDWSGIDPSKASADAWKWGINLPWAIALFRLSWSLTNRETELILWSTWDGKVWLNFSFVCDCWLVSSYHLSTFSF